MSASRERQDELRKELDVLNAEVDAAVAKRTAWMNVHMADFAKYAIGETLYEADGTRIGKVKDYYRYHGRDPQYDRSMSISYNIERSPGLIDNSSCRSDLVYNAKELADRIAWMTAPRVPSDELKWWKKPDPSWATP